eukprot:g219.t1
MEDARRRERKERKRKRKKEKKKRKKRKSRRRSDSESESSSYESSAEERERKSRRRKAEAAGGDPDRGRNESSRDEKKREKRNYASSVLTDEDKRRAKAERKARKRQALLGYTNQNNPFGDAQLSKPFTWHKKNQKDVADGTRSRAPTLAEQRKMRDANIEEIKKVQKRREAREKEKEEQEELRMMEMRLREAEQHQDWELKERAFNDNQLKRRVVIRSKEGRERLIDLFAKNYLVLDPPKKSAYEEDDADDAAIAALVERRPPHEILSNDEISISDLEELLEDVRQFERMSQENPHGDYWSELSVLVTAALHRARMRAAALVGAESRGRSVVPDSVRKDIDTLFEGKSSKELRKTESDIRDIIGKGRRGDGTTTIDVEFYEAQLRQIREHIARARLSELQDAALARRRELIGAGESAQVERDDRIITSTAIDDVVPYDPATMGPSYEPDDAGADIVDEVEDMRDLQRARERVLDETRSMLRSARSNRDATDGGERGDEEGRLNEGALAADPSRTYAWADKYKPRKPRYFNRVKTGYDWNKYNRTHYDHDNPPPKTVQGYKFNIFYPDLIDRSTVPQYVLEPCADNNDFCIIRFSAGPPYQDLAFKIVNKEWATQRKRGFKCVFQRGVLQLSFNFKRHFYRR